MRNRAHRVGHGRVPELYEPTWYKRYANGETGNREKTKKFIFPLDLLPAWALQGVHLFQATGIRTVHGKFGRTAFNAEIKSLGSNQFETKRT